MHISCPAQTRIPTAAWRERRGKRSFLPPFDPGMGLLSCINLSIAHFVIDVKRKKRVARSASSAPRLFIVLNRKAADLENKSALPARAHKLRGVRNCGP